MDSIPEGMKRCRKCDAYKLLDEFYKNKNCKDGLFDQCRFCLKERKQKYRAANKEKVRIAAKAYRIANRERLDAQNKAYRKAHPERERAYERVKRARKMGAEGKHTAVDVAKQFTAQKGKCWWCGCKLKKSGKQKYHADHVIALARGGSNGPENIVCSCPTCNMQKNSKTPLEFAGRLF